MILSVRWLSFAIVALLYMQAQFHRIAPAAVAAQLQTDLALTSTQLGVLAATYFYVYTALQLPTGLLADRWGPRPLILIGGLLTGLGSILFGLGHDFYTVLAGRFVVGVGVSVFFIAFLKQITLGFEPARFATLTGLIVFLGNVGAMSATAPLASLITIMSWKSVFIGLGVPAWVLTALACWRVRMPPVGQTETPVGLRRSLKTVMGNRGSWPPFLACGGIAGSFLTFAGLWATPWLMTVLKADTETAGRHGFVLLGAFALSSLFTGWLADRIGRRKLLLGLLSGSYTALWLTLTYAPIALGWQSYALFAGLGFTVSAYTLTWGLAKDVNPAEYSGTATSLVNAAAFASTGVLQPLLGWLLDATGRSAQGFQYAMLILTLTAASGWAAGLFSREKKKI